MFYSSIIPDTIMCSFGILRPNLKSGNIIFFENPINYCNFDRFGLVAKILIPLELPVNYTFSKGLLTIN